jgi:2'-5' RNA ligase
VRLFVAVWPPDDVIDLISGLPRPEVPGLRWSPRPQWHVTLRFLGEVERADEFGEALRQLSGSGIAKAVLGPETAWFPGRRVLQVPVVGLDDLSRLVNQAIAHIDDGRSASVGPEAGFRGHLTLARVRGRSRIDREHASQVEGTRIQAEWTVRQVSLVASTLRADGARYSDFVTVDLGA